MNPQDDKPSTVKQPLHLDDAVAALLDALRGIERALTALSVRMERLEELTRKRTTTSPAGVGTWSTPNGLLGS